MCRNNTRSLTYALANYHSTYDTFPAAVLSNPELPPDRRLSWLFELDPYIHARMDEEWLCYRKQPWDSDDNLRLARQRMPWCICPARGSEVDDAGLTVTSYVGAAGIGSEAANLPKDDPKIGVFGYDRRISIFEITDGMSTTVAVIETTKNGPWMAGGWPTTRGLDPAHQPYLGSGQPFGSKHVGGMMIGFADGSSRFLRDSVSPAVLEALFTIAAGDDPGVLPDERGEDRWH
jgi:hypothetical protein